MKYNLIKEIEEVDNNKMLEQNTLSFGTVNDLSSILQPMDRTNSQEVVRVINRKYSNLKAGLVPIAKS